MFCPYTVPHLKIGKSINNERRNGDCTYFIYVLFISFSSLSVWFSVHRPPLPLRWPSYLIYQLSAEVLSALAFQIETLLWLGPWDAVPSPWANTRLDSYHVSSHYQQSRALGRQWERSGGEGPGGEGPEDRPSITLRAPSRLLTRHWNTHQRGRRAVRDPRRPGGGQSSPADQ